MKTEYCLPLGSDYLNRKSATLRVIIVGVRNNIGWEYEFPKMTHSQDGKDGLPIWVSVSEALEGLPDPDSENDIPNHTYSKYKLNINGYIGHRLLGPDKPAPTVTVRGDNRGGVVIHPHPNGQRRMSCRELALVQSFPIAITSVGISVSPPCNTVLIEVCLIGVG